MTQVDLDGRVRLWCERANAAALATGQAAGGVKTRLTGNVHSGIAAVTARSTLPRSVRMTPCTAMCRFH